MRRVIGRALRVARKWSISGSNQPPDNSVSYWFADNFSPTCRYGSAAAINDISSNLLGGPASGVVVGVGGHCGVQDLNYAGHSAKTKNDRNFLVGKSNLIKLQRYTR